MPTQLAQTKDRQAYRFDCMLIRNRTLFQVVGLSTSAAQLDIIWWICTISPWETIILVLHHHILEIMQDFTEVAGQIKVDIPKYCQ